MMEIVAAMRALSPVAWASHLSGPPMLTSDPIGGRSGLIRRWRGTEADMSQPPLDHHYVVLHLGGPKRVTRTGEGVSITREVEEGALTIVPAGTRYEWRTEGPIDFAHLYVHPARLNHAVAMTFDRDAAAVSLRDEVGVSDPLLRETLLAMLDEVERRGAAGRPYMEVLFDAALATLVRRHSSAGEVTAPARHALAPVRLRRVLDFMESALGEPVDLARLAEVAGLSRFHFSRAFRSAMGEPPLAYLTRRRLEGAKRLLRSSDQPLREVARQSGFASPSRFAHRFRRHTGLSPSDYRRHL